MTDRLSVPSTEARVPHISLVFREMWDTTALDAQRRWLSLDDRPVCHWVVCLSLGCLPSTQRETQFYWLLVTNPEQARKFYKRLIEKADKRYKEHLDNL